MKTCLMMAISANGIIARKNGEEDFLSEKNWQVLFDLAQECGNLVIGRKTYDNVFGVAGFDFSGLAGVQKLVISRQADFRAEGFEVVASPQAAMEKLAEAGFEKLLISGGSMINSLFAKSNLIDRIVLVIEPVIIGEGIPLFSTADFDLKLTHISTEELEDGRYKVEYEVTKGI